MPENLRARIEVKYQGMGLILGEMTRHIANPTILNLTITHKFLSEVLGFHYCGSKFTGEYDALNFFSCALLPFI